MYREKRILAVVPARGGSKGVPLKNIHPLCGKPLIAHTGRLINSIDLFDRAVVSTDNDKIKDASVAAGLDAPFTRPPELSGDRIGDYDVLRHALLEIERLDASLYDVVVMLQPTSPLRKQEHVTHCIRKLIDDDLDAVWTLSPTDFKYHPLKALDVDDDGRMALFDQRGANIIARQQLRPVYHRNGAAYALTRTCLLEKQTILPEDAGAVIVREPMVSIDTLEDFQLVEQEFGVSPMTELTNHPEWNSSLKDQ